MVYNCFLFLITSLGGGQKLLCLSPSNYTSHFHWSKKYDGHFSTVESVSFTMNRQTTLRCNTQVKAETL